MTACTHHLANDPTALACVRPAGHVDGHRYESTSGVPDCPKEEL